MMKVEKRFDVRLTETRAFEDWYFLVLVAVIALAPVRAVGQQPNGTPPILPPVEVIGDANRNSRRDSEVLKSIVPREELLKYSGTTLGAALAHIPGLTVTTYGDEGVEIKLRGLGRGYTQVLLDGEPPPPGFSIGGLSADLVERVEIIRSATAEAGSQAIAGTVNVVLRRPKATDAPTVKNWVGGYSGSNSAGATASASRKDGNRTTSITGSFAYNNDKWPSTVDQVQRSQMGPVAFRWRDEILDRKEQFSLEITPGATWKLGEGKAFSLDALIQARRSDVDTHEEILTVEGYSPQFPVSGLAIGTRSYRARLTASLKARLSNDIGMDLRVTAAGSDKSTIEAFVGHPTSSGGALTREISARLIDRSLGSSGKIVRGLNDQHSLSVGWDGQHGQTFDKFRQREAQVSGLSAQELDDRFEATTDRLALFAQDLWRAGDSMSVYLGVRWEALRTIAKTNESRHNTRSAVLSPSLQLTWKLGDVEKDDVDQIQLALARTYKPPTTRELVPDRKRENNNTATTPDFQGNPALRPELSWGLDASYEKYFGDGAVMTTGAYARDITDVILPRTSLVDGIWIERPENSGRARVVGIEAEGKAPLQLAFTDAPRIEMIASLGIHHSRVRSVRGPGNLLATQPSRTAKVGFDWRLGSGDITWGANWTYQKGDFIRMTETHTRRESSRHSTDAYVAWTPVKGSLFRVSVTNLLALTDVSDATYQDALIEQSRSTRSKTFRAVRVVFETKL